MTNAQSKMNDYTYDRYSEALRDMARLAYKLWRKEHGGTYRINELLTEEMKEQAQLLQQYQDYEQKNCMMWRPWETHVGYALCELRQTDGFMFSELNGRIFMSWVAYPDDDNETEEHEAEDKWNKLCMMVESPAARQPPAPIKVKIVRA